MTFVYKNGTTNESKKK